MRLPIWIAWLVTFLFVNFTWVFFRANSLQDAARVLHGMFDVSSFHSESLGGQPTWKLAWGGHFSDRLIEILPTNVAANCVPILMIAAALFIIRQKNSFDLTVDSGFGWTKIFWMLALFGIALYSTIQSTSTVFLYFNF